MAQQELPVSLFVGKEVLFLGFGDLEQDVGSFVPVLQQDKLLEEGTLHSEERPKFNTLIVLVFVSSIFHNLLTFFAFRWFDLLLLLLVKFGKFFLEFLDLTADLLLYFVEPQRLLKRPRLAEDLTQVGQPDDEAIIRNV